jgi:hypothetical protein
MSVSRVLLVAALMGLVGCGGPGQESPATGEQENALPDEAGDVELVDIMDNVGPFFR